VLSILHRLTGIALAIGSIVLAWWLVAVAAGGEVFAVTHAFIASPIGVILLFGWSVAQRGLGRRCHAFGRPASALSQSRECSPQNAGGFGLYENATVVGKPLRSHTHLRRGRVRCGKI
jgi:hypothetical protein